MAANATLRQLGGLTDQPASLADSTLIMIDCQKAMVRTRRIPARSAPLPAPARGDQRPEIRR